MINIYTISCLTLRKDVSINVNVTLNESKHGGKQMTNYAINFGQGYQEYFGNYYYKSYKNNAEYNEPRSYYEIGEYFRNNGDYDSAYKYYNKAYDYFQKYAELGDPQSYYYLGYLYQYGYGVEQDYQQAEKYYQQAYKQFEQYQGKPEYLYLLGRLYESGFNKDTGKLDQADYSKAAYYYSQAAYYYYPDALYRLGYLDALRSNN